MTPREREAFCEDEVHRWEAEGFLNWHGPTDDVRQFIAQSSVYVLPSYHEGTPRTVLEAMAMGRPIITTDAAGCRQTVTEGVNGFLVPVRDAMALARAMERFLEHPELISRLGEQSRTIAVEKYDARKVGRATVRLMGLSTVEPRETACPVSE